MKYVSIIVPTVNSENDVRLLCESARKLDLLKRAEFIFVDSHSQDDTVKILETYNVKVIALDHIVSKGKARNIGIENAIGHIVVNVDADVEFLPGWYEALVDTMDYADIVAGYAEVPNNILPRVGIIIDGQDISHPCCNIAHKKRVFDALGLFDEAQGQAEDIEFNYRCVTHGYSIVYNPKMKLLHHQRSTKSGWWKQAFWNGEARYELIKIHPELFSKQQHGMSLKNFIRLGIGFLGYTFGRFAKRPGEKVWRLKENT